MGNDNFETFFLKMASLLVGSSIRGSAVYNSTHSEVLSDGFELFTCIMIVLWVGLPLLTHVMEREFQHS